MNRNFAFVFRWLVVSFVLAACANATHIFDASSFDVAYHSRRGAAFD